MKRYSIYSQEVPSILQLLPKLFTGSDIHLSCDKEGGESRHWCCSNIRKENCNLFFPVASLLHQQTRQ